MIFFSVWAIGNRRKSQIEMHNAYDSENANISDTLANIDSIKYFGKDKQIKSNYEKISDKTRVKLKHFYDTFNVFIAGHIIIAGIGTILIILFLPIEIIIFILNKSDSSVIYARKK